MATLASLSANSIDLETITTLAGILGTTAEDVSTANEIMENQLVYDLATDFTGDNIADFTNSENIYTSEKSEAQVFANQIESALRSTFDIVTSVGSSDGNFALSVQYIEPETNNFDSISNSIGNNISKSIEIVAPTEAIYDTHLRISSTDNNGPFYDSSNMFSAMFDGNNSNSNIIRALNSQFCTTDNSNPLAVEEHVTFNQAYSGNPISNKYFTLDASNGEPIVHELDNENNYYSNGFSIYYDASILTDNSQFGSYNIEQTSNIPTLSVSTNTDEPHPPVDSTISDNLPVFNSTLGLNNNNKLPKSLDIDTYTTLFSDEEPWGDIPGYEFSMTINEDINSGFVLQDSDGFPVLSDANGFFSLDNSNLVDNFNYMANYVSGSSNIDFFDASLNIVVGVNGESANISNNLLSLNDGIETLNEQEFNDGQIVLNINSVATRVNELQNDGVDQSSVLKTEVIYNDEDGENGRLGIASDVKNNAYVRYINQLVVKNSSNDINYSVSNGASFNLLSNSTVVNDNFNAGDIQFEYNNNINIADDILQVIKLNVYQNLRTEDASSLINNTDDMPVANYYVNGYITNFTSLLTSGQTLDKIVMDVNLKPVNELSMYTVAVANGWELTNFTKYQNDVLNTDINTVSSSVSSANPENAALLNQLPTYWPNIYRGTKYFNGSINDTNEIRTMVGSSDYNINYTVSLTTNPIFSTTQPVFYFDANVSWGMNPVGAQNPSKPWNISLPETIKNLTNNEPTYVVVDPSTYSLADVSLPNASNISLLYYTVTNTVQCSFKVGLLPYDNLTLKSPEFSVTYNYYLLQYTMFDVVLTNASELADITSTDQNNLLDYTYIESSIFGLAGDNSLTFEGTLVPDDFKELTLQTFGLNDDGTSDSISEPVANTAFYSIPVKIALNTEYRADPTLNIPPIYGDIVINFSGTTPLPLNSQDGYKVKFIVNSDATYAVSSFTSPISQLGQNISNFANNSLTVSNAYSSITNWDTTSFSVQGATDASGTTVITVIDANEDTVFTITTYDYNYINTQAFVTKCNSDGWRVQKQIGSASDDYQLDVSYLPTMYSVVSNGNTFNNMFSPDVGVYILGNSVTLSLSSIEFVDYVYDFTLLQDYIAVNMIGNAGAQLEPIAELAYQYVNGGNYSRTLALAQYRGYYGSQSVNQVYALNRDQLVAQFSTTIDGATVSQSFNVYNGTYVTVDNLIDGDGNSIGSIGLQLAFNISLLSSSNDTNYPVFVIGDNVTINIVNPNYEGFSPVTINTSLANYELYSFSGTNFDSTGGPLRIASSRLKLRNSDLDNNSASYTLFLDSSTINLYFSEKYLGNPADYGNWSSETLLFSDKYEQWLQSNEGGYGFGTGNGNNSFMQIFRLPNTPVIASNSYFVVSPAYFKFYQTGNFVQETDMPYSPSVNASANVVLRYLPIDNYENVNYTPFASNTYQYITGEYVTVDINSVNTNNVAFEYEGQTKKIYDYIDSPVSSKYEIVVNGNYYTIDVYLGLKNSPAALYISTIFEDVANNLLLLPETSTTPGDLHWVSSNNNNSGVTVSYLQPLITSSSNGLTLSDVFADPNVENISDNIRFEVNSFFLQVDSNTSRLNVPILQGVNVSMFTKAINVDNSGNMSINVYKYSPVANNVSKSTQVTTMFYYTRQVKSIPIPGIEVQDSVVPDFRNMVNSLSFTSVSAIAWEDDNAFNDTDVIVFASVVNLTKLAISAIEPLIFACETNGIKKITLVNKQPLLKIVNKVGMPILEIDANGIIKSPIVSTNAIVLNNPVTTSINSSLSYYPLYSILGNINDNVV